MPECLTHVPCINMCCSFGCAVYEGPDPNGWDYNGSGQGVTAGCNSNVNFPNSVGDTVYDENLDRLAGSINEERARRVGLYPTLTPYVFQDIDGTEENLPEETPPNGTLINKNNVGNVQERFREITDSINQMSGGAVVIDYSGNVKYATVRDAKDTLTALRAQCVCDFQCGANTNCPCHQNCTCYGYDENYTCTNNAC